MPASIVRRASPLWLRTHQDRHGRWHLRALALLAEWLPAEATLEITTAGRHLPVARWWAPEEFAEGTEPISELGLALS